MRLAHLHEVFLGAAAPWLYGTGLDYNEEGGKQKGGDEGEGGL